MARYSEAHNKDTQKYIENNYDEIKIRISKGMKDEYKAMAETSGKSLNQFIIDAVEDYGKKV